ncbi:MAG: hypothetical protein Q9207_007993 [Kuettlingeria erythrocarpa]
MIPYAHQLRVLDKVYLDTTFALDEEPYRRFPSKASGLRELLIELSAFPKDTVFHFNAWTLGYEDVFIAIAAHLRSQLGTKCSTLEKSSKVVWITPLITRSKRGNVPELGAGGGGRDLIQSHELDLGDPEAGLQLIELCGKQIRDEKALRLTVHLVEKMVYSSQRMVDLSRLDGLLTEDAIPLEKLAYLLSEVADQEDNLQHHDELPLQSVYRHISAPIRNAREIKGDLLLQIVRQPKTPRRA